MEVSGVRSPLKGVENMSVSAHPAAACAGEQPQAQRPRYTEVLRVKKLNADAILPTRGSAGAAGYDLSSAQDGVVPSRGKALIKTGLSIAIPEGTYARIAPRSGLAWKNSIDTGAGVVDYDYRGEVGVILFNFSDVDFQVKKGDRVAQLILERIMTPDVVEVDELDDTQRGASPAMTHQPRGCVGPALARPRLN